MRKLIFGHPVQSSWFYMNASEKIKFNWFCYEYACVLFDQIKKSKNKVLRKWAGNRSEEYLAEFCAYFSKRMKKSVLDQLSGLTEETEGDEEYICDYCHTNTHRENIAILDVAGEAWEELLSVCVTCPNRCISERRERCRFFERMERGGYF